MEFIYLDKTDAEKRAAKAKKTKTARRNADAELREELVKKDKALAKVRAELKATKTLIADGWRPKE